MSDKDKLNQMDNAKNDAIKELPDDELDLVTGGANPFAGVDRVPNSKIDKGLRDKA